MRVAELKKHQWNITGLTECDVILYLDQEKKHRDKKRIGYGIGRIIL